MTEPNAPAQQGYAQPAAPADYPGKTLGLVGLIVAIIAPLIGLIISIVARNQSKAAGVDNKLAKAGIIVGIVLMVLYIVGYGLLGVVAANSGGMR